MSSRLLRYTVILLALLSTAFLLVYRCVPGMAFFSPPVGGFEVQQEYLGGGPFGPAWLVHFRDTSTGNITRWSWYFHNDGDVDSNEQNLSRVFDKAGPHFFKLVVEGPGGRSEVSKRVVLIKKDPPPLEPVAIFTAWSTSGTSPLEVRFVDQSAGTITEWTWDFDGDGTTDSTERNPTYTYTTPGTYDVNLTVTGPGGTNSLTRQGYIQVK